MWIVLYILLNLPSKHGCRSGRITVREHDRSAQLLFTAARPVTLTDLQHCRTLFLFDFQQAINDKPVGLKEVGLKPAPIKAPRGLCVPAGYLAVCQAGRDASYAKQLLTWDELLKKNERIDPDLRGLKA
jgi:hypothetical protein